MQSSLRDLPYTSWRPQPWIKSSRGPVISSGAMRTPTTSGTPSSSSGLWRSALRRRSSGTPESGHAEDDRGGNAFIAPAGWSVTVRGPATILEAPEGDSRIALVDVRAQRRRRPRSPPRGPPTSPKPKWPLKVATDVPDKDGWSKQRATTATRRRRTSGATCGACAQSPTAQLDGRASTTWPRRSARSAARRSALIFDRLLPKGYAREIVRRQDRARARRRAHRRARRRSSRTAQQGDRRARRRRSASCRTARSSSPAASACASWASRRKVDADTLFMIASNTKALTTLLLAQARRRGQADAGRRRSRSCCRRSSSATPTRPSRCWSST